MKSWMNSTRDLQQQRQHQQVLDQQDHESIDIEQQAIF